MGGRIGASPEIAVRSAAGGPALAAALWLVAVIATALLGFVRRGAYESADELLEIELQPTRVGGCGAAGIAVGVAILISIVSGWGGVVWAAIALLGLGLVAWHHRLVRIDRRAGTLVWVTAIGPLRRTRAPTPLGTPTEVIVRTLVVGDPTSTQRTEYALALATRDGEHDFGTFASGGVVNAAADRLAAFLGVPRRGP